MTIEFTISDVIPAAPQQVYDTWLDAKGHAAMTGAGATASSKTGRTFTAWDDYISGTNLALDPGRRIVQAWRTTAFADDDPDSRLDILLEPVAGGTKLTLRHSNVPNGHTTYQGGWSHHYFEPMKAYFAAR
jgi:uncharacterized protein YndB with AHSA1/START domain